MANPGSTAVTLAPSTSPKNEENQGEVFGDADYHPIVSNWYTAKPYGFKFTPKTGSSHALTMFLPINPSNLTVTTNFATNLVSTIYGTVEEHSPVRYYDITIEGTTGMGPKYLAPFNSNSATPVPALGRTAFTVKQGINAAGFFTKTLNTAQSAITNTKKLLGLTPSEVSTGLQLDQTGYIAFHNLFRFLLKYKKDASGDDQNKLLTRPQDNNGDVHPLIFFNYKDNNQYKVVIRSMMLRRDKDNPMLYNYSISMRGYDLTDADNPNLVAATDDQKTILQNLGLYGVKGSSFLTDAKNFSSQAKAILGSVGAGINQLGR